MRRRRAAMAAAGWLAALVTTAEAQTAPHAAPAAEEPTGRAALAAELARAVQNPVANLISLPFQNNTNFNYGPFGHVQNILNIQPVVPIGVTPDWNVVTRTILPVISQPAFRAGEDTTFGLGATQFNAFLSPAKPGAVIWGVGAVAQAPTITDKNLGSTVWGGGPTAVALTMQGPWVIGALANNIWSAGGNAQNRYNILTVQPFINYNFGHGTSIGFSPIITANWDAKSGDQWTVPLGLALSQILFLGNQPVSVQLGSYYNVVRPDIGPEWQVRFQLSFLFPK
jgi:hypothetical protein